MTRTLAIALLLSGPLAGAAVAESLLPLALAALPDETMALKVHAVGMQLYECKPGADGKLAWTFIAPLIEGVMEQLGRKMPLRYTGRKASASPAVGKMSLHLAELKAFLDAALSL